MIDRFDFFVVLAEMRTGSNFLEENLNDVPGLHSHGEVFNPNFIGHAKTKTLFGYSMTERESEPLALIQLLRDNTQGLAGFRLFHDHDPRVLQHCLENPRCAKIVLTRNPLESYVSLKIVQQTGQWRLNDMRHAKSAQVTFDREEFERHLTAHQGFQTHIQHALQSSGQTAFYLGYEDIPDTAVLNGLATYLGVDHQKRKATRKTKKQNPEPLESKVTNYPEMVAALATVDHFALNRTPSFEPRRGPTVPGYIAAEKAGLLFMPIGSGPDVRIRKWLAAVEGCAPDNLLQGFTQKTLRQWKRKSRGHQSFAVVRHPVARLHACFVDRFLNPGPRQYTAIRQVLRETYKVPLPADPEKAVDDPVVHREAFLAFAAFIRGNLSDQTSIRIDGAWASQAETVSGMAQFSLPDHVLRETDLQAGLDFLTRSVGRPAQPVAAASTPKPISLDDIYDKDVEAAVRAAYQRDYMMFGFGPWAELA